MKIIKTTEIMIEKLETRIVRVGRRETQLEFCEICRARVTHFSVSRAAALLRLSEAAIFRLTESKKVHSFESEIGALLVCGNSLEVMAAEIREATK